MPSLLLSWNSWEQEKARLHLPSKRLWPSRAAGQQPTYNLIQHKLPRLGLGTEDLTHLGPFRP